jgi:hypothetical protein
MSDASSESEAQCRSTHGKSSTSSPTTTPEMLASEVTPVLQQEQIPTPISLCHDLFNGVIKWKLNHNDVVLTPKLGQACKGK